MAKKFGPKSKNGRLSNLPIESLEFNFLYVLFRRFPIHQRHITSHSPNRSPCSPKQRPALNPQDTELGALMFPTQLSECQDTHCNREEAVNWFAVDMMEAVQTAEETALPFPKAGKAVRE